MWLKLFWFVCLFHLGEHVAQIIELYVYNMPMHRSGGILGVFAPWLLHSETLHYAYALFMWVGLWMLRGHFTGPARWWWMLAFWIQTWHHFEHVLLLWQATTGNNFFGAAQPISVIQFLGFLNGTPADGFGGLLKMSHFGECNCPGAKVGTVHEWTPWLLVIRRPEVHFMYNLAVTIPMVMAMIRPKLGPIWRYMIGDRWEVVGTTWPYAEGYGTFNRHRNTLLDSGLTRERAEAAARELNDDLRNP